MGEELRSSEKRRLGTYLDRTGHGAPRLPRHVCARKLCDTLKWDTKLVALPRVFAFMATSLVRHAPEARSTSSRVVAGDEGTDEGGRS